MLETEISSQRGNDRKKRWWCKYSQSAEFDSGGHRKAARAASFLWRAAERRMPQQKQLAVFTSLYSLLCQVY